MSEAPERHKDLDRNRLLNQCSADLENIINGHDPEIHNLNNRVWDRLDKLALDIEARTADLARAQVAEAYEAAAQIVDQLAKDMDSTEAMAAADWIRALAQEDGE